MLTKFALLKEKMKIFQITGSNYHSKITLQIN